MELMVDQARVAETRSEFPSGFSVLAGLGWVVAISVLVLISVAWVATLVWAVVWWVS